MTRRSKRRWSSSLTEVIILLVVLFGVRAYLQRDMASGEAPPLTGVTTAGQQVSLRQFRGRPLLIHFWATWCPICRAEHANIEAVAGDHAVITVAIHSGAAQEVSAYLAHRGWAAPTLVDPQGALAQRFGVVGVPASFVLDREGRIRFAERGYTTTLGLRLRLWLASLR